MKQEESLIFEILMNPNEEVNMKSKINILILKMVIRYYNILIKIATKKDKMDLVEEFKEKQGELRELIKHEKLRNELMRFAKKIDL